MRKLVLSSAVAATVLVMGASCAMAATNVTGAVSVTGTVTNQCSVTAPTAGSTFSGTIPLGTLNGADGTISTSLRGSTISGASLSFTVICNTATPQVQLSATAMSDGVTPATGFTSTVDYTSQLTLTDATGGKENFTYVTAGSPAATTGTMTNPLSGTKDNVVVSVNTLNTDGGANTSILTAGSYGSAAGGTGGLISITISP